MKPIEFEGSNIIFGKNQKEYDNLPAKISKGVYGKAVFLWELTESEKHHISENKELWLTVLTFNTPPQIVWPSSKEMGALNEPIETKVSKDGRMSLRFNLDKKEADAIVKNGNIWVTVITGHQPLQPLYDSIFEPIVEIPKGTAKGVEKLIKKNQPPYN